jgi:CubicO group peptidase (beta-lactamase class C family)
MRIGTGCRKSPGQLLSAFLLGIIAPSLWGQSPAQLDSVNRFIRSELARQRIPGASVAILRGDTVVLSQGYGWANVELRVPASDSTIYQSGSMGKQFTAAGIMLLVGQGRLQLEDRITRWLPEGKGVWDSVTIRHLLTHTGGIAEYTDSTFDYRKDYTEDQLVRFAASRPLDFVPGQRWSYSNTGYLLLGVLIHRVTGQFYGDVLHRLIFAPVGMNTTRVISEADIIPNRAAGYQLIRGEVKNQSWVSPTLNTTADGALYFSVKDLARWAETLNHGDLPGKAVLDAAWTPVHLNDGGTYPYGFGWDLTDQRGHPRVGHTGSWQGFKTALYRYPEYGLSIIMLANLDQAHPGPIVQGIAGILEPALLPPHVTAKVSPAQAPSSIPALLTAIAAGKATTNVSDGLRRFIAPAFRKDVSDLLHAVQTWTMLGCDLVVDRHLSRLGSPVERICYARGTGPAARSIVAVSFTPDSAATFLDWYDY